MLSVLVAAIAMQTFLMDVNKEDVQKEMKECMERVKKEHPCPHEDKQIQDIPDEEQAGVYHCRTHRYLKCALAPPPEDKI